MSNASVTSMLMPNPPPQTIKCTFNPIECTNNRPVLSRRAQQLIPNTNFLCSDSFSMVARNSSRTREREGQVWKWWWREEEPSSGSVSLVLLLPLVVPPPLSSLPILLLDENRNDLSWYLARALGRRCTPLPPPLGPPRPRPGRCWAGGIVTAGHY